MYLRSTFILDTFVYKKIIFIIYMYLMMLGASWP